MIVAFKVSENYCHVEHYPALLESCRSFAGAFPDVSCEFFYYLKPFDPDRWFFIRAATGDGGRFVSAATHFAGNLNFEILTRAATEPLLKRIKLNTFV